MERRFWGSSMKRTQETFVYIGPQSLDTWIYMSDFQLEHPGRWQEAQLFRLWQLPFRNCPGVSGAVIVRIHSQSWGGSSCWLPRVGEGLDASSPTQVIIAVLFTSGSTCSSQDPVKCSIPLLFFQGAIGFLVFAA